MNRSVLTLFIAISMIGNAQDSPILDHGAKKPDAKTPAGKSPEVRVREEMIEFVGPSYCQTKATGSTRISAPSMNRLSQSCIGGKPKQDPRDYYRLAEFFDEGTPPHWKTNPDTITLVKSVEKALRCPANSPFARSLAETLQSKGGRGPSADLALLLQAVLDKELRRFWADRIKQELEKTSDIKSDRFAQLMAELAQKMAREKETRKRFLSPSEIATLAAVTGVDSRLLHACDYLFTPLETNYYRQLLLGRDPSVTSITDPPFRSHTPHASPALTSSPLTLKQGHVHLGSPEDVSRYLRAIRDGSHAFLRKPFQLATGSRESIRATALAYLDDLRSGKSAGLLPPRSSLRDRFALESALLHLVSEIDGQPELRVSDQGIEHYGNELSSEARAISNDRVLQTELRHIAFGYEKLTGQSLAAQERIRLSRIPRFYLMWLAGELDQGTGTDEKRKELLLRATQAGDRDAILDLVDTDGNATRLLRLFDQKLTTPRPHAGTPIRQMSPQQLEDEIQFVVGRLLQKTDQGWKERKETDPQTAAALTAYLSRLDERGHSAETRDRLRRLLGGPQRFDSRFAVGNFARLADAREKSSSEKRTMIDRIKADLSSRGKRLPLLSEWLLFELDDTALGMLDRLRRIMQHHGVVDRWDDLAIAPEPELIAAAFANYDRSLFSLVASPSNTPLFAGDGFLREVKDISALTSQSTAALHAKPDISNEELRKLPQITDLISRSGETDPARLQLLTEELLARLREEAAAELLSTAGSHASGDVLAKARTILSLNHDTTGLSEEEQKVAAERLEKRLQSLRAFSRLQGSDPLGMALGQFLAEELKKKPALLSDDSLLGAEEPDYLLQKRAQEKWQRDLERDLSDMMRRHGKELADLSVEFARAVETPTTGNEFEKKREELLNQQSLELGQMQQNFEKARIADEGLRSYVDKKRLAEAISLAKKFIQNQVASGTLSEEDAKHLLPAVVKSIDSFHVQRNALDTVSQAVAIPRDRSFARQTHAERVRDPLRGADSLTEKLLGSKLEKFKNGKHGFRLSDELARTLVANARAGAENRQSLKDTELRGLLQVVGELGGKWDGTGLDFSGSKNPPLWLLDERYTDGNLTERAKYLREALSQLGPFASDGRDQYEVLKDAAFSRFTELAALRGMHVPKAATDDLYGTLFPMFPGVAARIVKDPNGNLTVNFLDAPGHKEELEKSVAAAKELAHEYQKRTDEANGFFLNSLRWGEGFVGGWNPWSAGAKLGAWIKGDGPIFDEKGQTAWDRARDVHESAFLTHRQFVETGGLYLLDGPGGQRFGVDWNHELLSDRAGMLKLDWAAQDKMEKDFATIRDLYINGLILIGTAGGSAYVQGAFAGTRAALYAKMAADAARHGVSAAGTMMASHAVGNVIANGYYKTRYLMAKAGGLDANGRPAGFDNLDKELPSYLDQNRDGKVDDSYEYMWPKMGEFLASGNHAFRTFGVARVFSGGILAAGAKPLANGTLQMAAKAPFWLEPTSLFVGSTANGVLDTAVSGQSEKFQELDYWKQQGLSGLQTAVWGILPHRLPGGVVRQSLTRYGMNVGTNVGLSAFEYRFMNNKVMPGDVEAGNFAEFALLRLAETAWMDAHGPLSHLKSKVNRAAMDVDGGKRSYAETVEAFEKIDAARSKSRPTRPEDSKKPSLTNEFINQVLASPPPGKIQWSQRDGQTLLSHALNASRIDAKPENKSALVKILESNPKMSIQQAVVEFQHQRGKEAARSYLSQKAHKKRGDVKDYPKYRYHYLTLKVKEVFANRDGNLLDTIAKDEGIQDTAMFRNEYATYRRAQMRSGEAPTLADFVSKFRINHKIPRKTENVGFFETLRYVTPPVDKALRMGSELRETILKSRFLTPETKAQLLDSERPEILDDETDARPIPTQPVFVGVEE